MGWTKQRFLGDLQQCKTPSLQFKDSVLFFEEKPCQIPRIATASWTWGDFSVDVYIARWITNMMLNSIWILPVNKFRLLLVWFHKNPRSSNIMRISLIQNHFNSFWFNKCHESKHPSLLAWNPYIFNRSKSTEVVWYILLWESAISWKCQVNLLWCTNILTICLSHEFRRIFCQNHRMLPMRLSISRILFLNRIRSLVKL